jgi:hypothetical protein
MRRILENRLSGVKTNQNNWQFIYPNDTSMNRVSEISNTFFDFGSPPLTQTQASETTVTMDGGGGGGGVGDGP